MAYWKSEPRRRLWKMNKKFDAVKMKHKIQEKIYKKLRPKSIDDYLVKLIEYSQKSNLAMKLKTT